MAMRSARSRTSAAPCSWIRTSRSCTCCSTSPRRALAISRPRRPAAYAEENQSHDWPRPIVDLYLGHGSPEAVELAAKDVAKSTDAAKDAAGQRFDADFYIGQWALLSGDQELATERLKSVYASRLREYLEFDIARADLNSLGSIAESPTPTPLDHPKKNVPTGSNR